MPKKKISLTLVFLVLLAILGFGGIWYWNTYKKKIIRNEVEKAIEGKSQGLYKVNYKNLELDEINGNLSVSSFTIQYDSLIFEQLRQEDKAPYLLFKILIPSLQISGVKTPRALLQKEITGRHLLIDRPTIEILYTNAGTDSVQNVPNKEIYKQILGNLTFIKLDSVVISNAEIITKNMRNGKSYVHMQDATIGLYDVSVDSTSEADSTRILYSRNVSLDCAGVDWKSDDHRYGYLIDSVSLNSATSNVKIKKISIKPQLGEKEFAKSLSAQADRYDFAISNIELRNVNFIKLAEEIIDADELSVGNASFKIFRDRTQKEKLTNKIGSYPHQKLMQMHTKMRIDKSSFRNVFLEYKEVSPVTGLVGKVQFSDLSADISNLTNEKAAIATDNKMIVHTKSRFLGKVPLTARWTFFLGNPNGKFTIDGEMGAADARTFNVLSEPMGPARFKSGKVNKMFFDLAGTDYQITGKVKLLYEDLKVTLLEKDDDGKGLNKKTVVSLLANFKIKSDNPDKNDPPRTGDVNTKRNPNRSMFNLAWKGLFDGLKNVTGAQ